MTLNSKSTGNNNILRGYILPCILTDLFGVIVAQFAEMKIKTLVLLTVVANCFRTQSVSNVLHNHFTHFAHQ